MQVYNNFKLILHKFYLLIDVPFPKTFMPICKKILTRLFRVFVHVYIHHFDRIVSIGAVSIIFNIYYNIMHIYEIKY